MDAAAGVAHVAPAGESVPDGLEPLPPAAPV